MVKNSKTRLQFFSYQRHRNGLGVRKELQVLILEPRLTNGKGMLPALENFVSYAAWPGKQILSCIKARIGMV